MQANKEIFYHGTCFLFDKFSLSFLGAGEGKSKFGQGIYITSSYKTAALYASKAAKANGGNCCYVYTVEVPLHTEDNHIFSRFVGSSSRHLHRRILWQKYYGPPSYGVARKR